MTEHADSLLVSAVIIRMPLQVDAFVQSFRQRNAIESLHPVPPHITLMWPFISPGYLGAVEDSIIEDTAAQLRNVCQDQKPFSITLDRYGSFPGTGVLFIAPADQSPIVRLHQHLFAAFPDYPPYGGEFDAYIPHMTLANLEDAEKLAKLDYPDIPPFSFDVDTVHYVYGTADMTVTWQSSIAIPLGG